jgi:3-hydroxyisobutyrate dehydrogenase-like beta-hydroxyacid dehydrogenase
MGRPMAELLVKAGYGVRVHNRTRDKERPLVEQGATPADRPAAVVPAPDGAVVTMLADDAALEAVTLGPGGILETLGAGGLHLSCSTVSPAILRRLAAEHERRGARLVGTPVFGRPDAAAAKKLWLTLAGAPAARQRARPILEAMGQGVFEFGDAPEGAAVVKVAGNFLIASAMEAMAEAFTLAEKSGIPRTAIAEFFGKTLFALPLYQNYGRMIAERRFEPAGFKLALGLKDVGLVLDQARAAAVPMPFAQQLHGRFLAAVARGEGGLDWSGLAAGVSRDAGLA